MGSAGKGTRVVHREGQIMDSRLRGNDAFLVAPAEAGVHASKQDWIPACAEERHSLWTEMLVRSTRHFLAPSDFGIQLPT